MTKGELEAIEQWMALQGASMIDRNRTDLVWQLIHAKTHIKKLLAELRDHEEWKARIVQDHDAYDQGVKDRTARFVEVLTALAEDQNKRMVYARHNPIAAKAYEQGRDFCGVLLKMIEEGLL